MDFNEAIRDARLLIAHAARSGASVSAEDASAIADFERVVADGQVTTQGEVAFWVGMGNLAKAVQPVTIDSLKANAVVEQGEPRGKAKAQLAVHTYRRWAMGTLVVLVLLQIYAFVGRTLLRDVGDMKKELKELQKTATPLTPESHQNPELVDRQLQLVSLASTIDSSYDMLRLWNLAWRIPASPILALSRFIGPREVDAADAVSMPEAIEDSEKAVRREIAQREARQLAGLEARFAVSSLTNYVLPALYGLLGTCVFILRNLASEIKAVSFASDVSYQLRLPLGALAGVAMVFFPEAMQQPVESALTHLTLAFVAGYSVEVLFSVMDRFIASFTGASPVKAT